MRRSAELRRCPKCGRGAAISRRYDVAERVGAEWCRWCDYTRTWSVADLSTPEAHNPSVDANIVAMEATNSPNRLYVYRGVPADGGYSGRRVKVLTGNLAELLAGGDVRARVEVLIENATSVGKPVPVFAKRPVTLWAYLFDPDFVPNDGRPAGAAIIPLELEP